ncbi:MAG TPA: hypothetical protein VOA41_10345 [Candidatus Dormibacteraeota bacterium]|nr:hypothetical protein [Candidatus Dormibacteraeota bacterium]
MNFDLHEFSKENVAFVESLRKQGISVKAGVTLKGHRIYFIENHIFTEEEIVRLLATGELNREGIRRFRKGSIGDSRSH